MADINTPQGYLQAYFQSLGRQEDQLRQPAPQQGGILAGADPVMLSLAAGLLSPTKTGGFGESVAAGLSAAQGPLSEIRKQEAARADKLSALEQTRAKLALDWIDAQNGGRSARDRDPTLNANIWARIAENLEGQLTNTLLDQNPAEYERIKKEAAYYRGKVRAIAGFEDEDSEAGLTEKPKTKEPPKTEEPAKTKEAGKTTGTPYTGDKPPPSYPNAKKGSGGWYIPDPDRPGKYLRVDN